MNIEDYKIFMLIKDPKRKKTISNHFVVHADNFSLCSYVPWVTKKGKILWRKDKDYGDGFFRHKGRFCRGYKNGEVKGPPLNDLPDISTNMHYRNLVKFNYGKTTIAEVWYDTLSNKHEYGMQDELMLPHERYVLMTQSYAWSEVCVPRPIAIVEAGHHYRMFCNLKGVGIQNKPVFDAKDKSQHDIMREALSLIKKGQKTD